MPPPSSASSKRSSRIRKLLPLLILVIALGIAAYFGVAHWLRKTDELAGLQLATIQRGNIEDVVTATGTLQPRDYVDVGAQVSGQLKKIHVEVGSEVAANDLLAEIDATVLQSKVDATRAQLRNQRAQLAERESTLQLAQTQYRRQQNLMAEDATTAETLQTAEASLRSARAQIEALKAQIDQTESNLRADQANLEYTRIYAPMAGTVVSISARQGQTLNANQSAPTILRIADLSTMTVQTQVSEADVSKLRTGMPVYFTTLGSPNRRWYGTLSKIEPTPTVTNNVVLYNALFDVPNENRSLMTQMTAQVFFVIAAAHDVLVAPLAALTPAREMGRLAPGGAVPSAVAAQGGAPAEGDIAPREARTRGPRAEGQDAGAGERRPPRPRGDNTAAPSTPRPATVRVLNAEGRLEERKVMTGARNRIHVQILEGLQEGERVVAGLQVAGNPGGGMQNRPAGMPPGAGFGPGPR